MLLNCLEKMSVGIAATLLCLSLFSATPLFAAETPTVKSAPLKPIIFPKDHGKHLSANHESLMFSGEIETEEGVKYAYMFQLKQKNNKATVFANIVELSSKKDNKKTVFNYKYSELLDKVTEKKDNKTSKNISISKNSDNPSNNGNNVNTQSEKAQKIKKAKKTHKAPQFIEWKVGQAFIKYNIIGDSWFFGVLDEKNGFNFRVKTIRTYVLNGDNGYLSHQGKSFQASYSAQSMAINGNLTLDGTSQFVTGKNSWFEHAWGKTFAGHQASKYVLITCRFNDNTGLMLYEKSAGSHPVILKTGTYQNALDEKKLLSNFYLAKSTKTGQWYISIPALKMNIQGVEDTIPEYDVIPVKNNKEGYCFVNQKGF